MRLTPSIFSSIVAVSVTACLAPPDPLPPLAGGDATPVDGAVAETDSAPPQIDASTGDDGSAEVGPADAGRDTGPDQPYFVGVTAGDSFACAWTDEGRTMCWGQNRHRQANPDEIDHAPPDWAWDDYRFETIDSGPSRNCGLTTDGELICWGRNAGDVVQNGNDQWLPPTPYERLSDFTVHPPTSVALGWTVTCVTTAEPAAYCWGDNGDWQVEPGVDAPSGYVDPTLWAGTSQISPGAAHSCQVSANTGGVSCWGANHSYKAVPRIDVTEGKQHPKRVDNRAYIAVSAAISHTCGVVSDGTVTCWGSNGSGRLGVEGSPMRDEMPVVVPGPTSIVSIDTWNDTCALASDGGAWCWGAFQEGDSPSLLRAGDGSAFESVAVGSRFACATSPSGVWCWGNNLQGQAGQFDGDTPIEETFPEPTLVPPPTLP